MPAYYIPIAHASPEVLSLDAAKKQLKVEDLGAFDDTIITDCIEAAIDEAESYIEANIRERKFTIYFQSWQDMFEFREQIVQSIDAIAYKDENNQNQTLDVNDTTELLPVDKYAKIIKFKDFDALPIVKEDVSDAIQISITTGYATNKVPKGLLQGIKLLVSENYNIRNNVESKGYRSAACRKLEPYKYYKKPIE